MLSICFGLAESTLWQNFTDKLQVVFHGHGIRYGWRGEGGVCAKQANYESLSNRLKNDESQAGHGVKGHG